MNRNFTWIEVIEYRSTCASKMTTYASPRLTRLSLQLLLTLIFIAGFYMTVVSVIRSIDYISNSIRAHRVQTKFNESTTPTLSRWNPDIDDTEPGFPSTSSIIVQLIFGFITLGHAIFGIVAITRQKIRLLSAYGYILVISSFIKILFLIGLYSFNWNK